MKKFNRFIAILLCFLTVLSCFSLVSCDNNTSSDFSSDDVKDTDTSTDTDTNTDTEIDTSEPDIQPEPELTIDELNKKNEVLAILDNNFLSRNEIVYENINGKDVTIYTSFRDKNEVQNNPNFSQFQMIWQAIKYKEKYPDKDVYISLSSYRISGTLSACLKEDSPEYGDLKMLRDKEYDEESGYYRICYLLCEAARKGIYVTVVGHLNASAVKLAAGAKTTADLDYITYFNSHLNDPCYIEGKVISDYMVALKSQWSLDKGSTDMMHLKACAVSNYVDRYGNDNGNAVWLGCTNLDGVDYLGRNGLDYIQSGVVIANHDEIYNATYNYIQLMCRYQKQEEVLVFRRVCQLRTTMQIDLILAGKGDTIPKDEQIVYLGTENDKVFELYFTPLGGPTSTWDTTYNPYCKYTTKLVNSKNEDGYIEFLLNNPKFLHNTFSVGKILLDVLNKKFLDSGNVENNLHLQAPGPDYSMFDGLIEGENIGAKQLNEYRSNYYHTKDVQMTYVEDGTRYYVTLYNSLNFHEGAMYYQTNSILVIKETEETGNDFYIDYAIMTTPGIEFESHRYATSSQ